MDKKILKEMIENDKKIFDLFLELYGLLISVRTKNRVGLSEKYIQEEREALESETSKIVQVLSEKNTPCTSEEINNFTLEWGEGQFNWLKKGH